MRDYKKDVPHWDGPEEMKVDGEHEFKACGTFSLFPPEVEKKLRRRADIVSIAERIVDVYEEAVKQEWIDKPVAYSIYQVWKEVDAVEVGRHKRIQPATPDEVKSSWIDHCYDCIHYTPSGKTKRGKCRWKGDKDIRYGSTRSCRYFVRRNPENTPDFENGMM